MHFIDGPQKVQKLYKLIYNYSVCINVWFLKQLEIYCYSRDAAHLAHNGEWSADISHNTNTGLSVHTI